MLSSMPNSRKEGWSIIEECSEGIGWSLGSIIEWHLLEGKPWSIREGAQAYPVLANSLPSTACLFVPPSSQPSVPLFLPLPVLHSGLSLLVPESSFLRPSFPSSLVLSPSLQYFASHLPGGSGSLPIFPHFCKSVRSESSC